MENDDKIFISYISDKLNTCARRNTPAVTYFLNGRQQTLAERLLKSERFDNYALFGGYEGAERRILLLLPDYLTKEDTETIGKEELTCLHAVFDKSESLSHRDFLGSLLGAGIRREAVGDILVSENSADFIVERSVAPYLKDNLSQIGRVRPNISEISLSDITVPAPSVKLIKGTVASARLDAVIATGFSMGREKASALVRSGKVIVNYFECDKPDKLLSEGDVVSARGFGKFKLSKVGGLTKKGRTPIEIERYV